MIYTKITITGTSPDKAMYTAGTKGTLRDDKILLSLDTSWEEFGIWILFALNTGEQYKVLYQYGGVYIPNEIMTVHGRHSCAVYGVDPANVGHTKLSEKAVLWVTDTLTANGNVNDPTLPQIQQMEAAFAAAKDFVTLKSSAAAASADAAKVSAANSAQSAGNAATQANAASLSRDVTDTNAATVGAKLTEATQAAIVAAAERTAADEAAKRAESAAASFPMRYYRGTIAEMELITSAKQGDLCYVTDYAAHESTLYTYDTADIDADAINPEWMLIGYLKFADLSRNDLLAVLKLAPAALSGSYTDLTNKPNRYESFAVINAVNGIAEWDYSVTDKIKITLSAAASLSISNVYNGAMGTIELYGGDALTLPAGSVTSADWNYLTAAVGQYFMISWLYDGTKYHFARTVFNDAV